MRKIEDEKTILTIVIGFLVLFFLFRKDYFLYLGFALGITALLSEYLCQKIAWFWWLLAEILGNISTKIILTMVYFVILLPLAFAFKLFNRDSLLIKEKSFEKLNSMYHERNKIYAPEDLINIW